MLEQAIGSSDVDAWFLYRAGEAAAKAGHSEAACALLQRAAAEVENGDVLAQANIQLALGNVHFLNERMEIARQHFENALSLHPAHPSARDNLVLLLRRQGMDGEALRLLRRILPHAEDPGKVVEQLMDLAIKSEDFGAAIDYAMEWTRLDNRNPDAHSKLGIALQRNGALQKAGSSYREALALNPEHADAMFNLGGVLYETTDFEESVVVLGGYCDLYPGSARAHYVWGAALYKLKRYEEAAEVLSMAEHLDPSHASTALLQGLVASELQDFGEAIRQYERALAIDGQSEQAFFHLARALFGAGRLSQAVETCLQGLEIINPSFLLHLELGILFTHTGDLDRALEWFRLAQQSDAGNPDLAAGQGMAMAMLGKFSEANRLVQDALAKFPEHRAAKWVRGWTALAMGEFDTGWDDYEYRSAAVLYKHREFPAKRWSGEPLAGKRIFISQEQGLGDEMMFSSCIPDLMRTGAQVVLECTAKLEHIFRRSFAGLEVVVKKRESDLDFFASLGSVEYWLPAGSLPVFFRRGWEKFPQHACFLTSDPSSKSHWSGRLCALGTGLKVGLAWRGGVVQTRSSLRSIPLEQLRSLFNTAGAYFVNLQYGDCEQEVREFNLNGGAVLHHFPDALADYEQTAALVDSLDVVVSVCSAIIHLAGAMGKPVFVMVPLIPEWRYLHAGERIPWYPSAKLIRQGQASQWGSVIENVGAKLREFKAAASTG